MENNNAKLTISVKRIFIKTIIILAIVNFGWIYITKLPIGDLSFYNILFKGRDRLPFGENPSKSYNLSLYDLDAMFASHEIDKKHSDADELHVVLIGDSSIWGFLQEPDNTLSGLLNKRFLDDDKKIIFHNLGYPSISILKDLVLIEKALEYEIDLFLWFITLEALPISEQSEIPIIKNNPVDVNSIIEDYELSTEKIEERVFDKTFWKQRRNISDLVDLQLFGILWDATGIDQEYPESYNPAQRDFTEPIEQYHSIKSDDKLEDFLALEIIKNGIERNKGNNFILINEPILISQGINSSFQYNYYYPRWAYDQYRLIMNKFTQENKILYYDLWNLIPEDEFTNSAIHLTENAENVLAEEIAFVVEDYIGRIEKNDKE